MALQEQAMPTIQGSNTENKMFEMKDNGGDTLTAHFDAVTAWTINLGESKSSAPRLRIYMANGSSAPLYTFASFTEMMRKHYADAFDTLFVVQGNDPRFGIYFLRADDITGWKTRAGSGGITTVYLRGHHEITGITVPLAQRVRPLRSL